MATQRQLRGGTAAEHEVFTGAEREVTVETDTGRLRTHDGSTAGGYPLALQSEAAGVVAVNFTTDADQALTAAQARNRTIIITDTTPVLTTGRSLTGFVEGATNIVNQTSVVLECFGPTANNGVLQRHLGQMPGDSGGRGIRRQGHPHGRRTDCGAADHRMAVAIKPVSVGPSSWLWPPRPHPVIMSPVSRETNNRVAQHETAGFRGTRRATPVSY